MADAARRLDKAAFGKQADFPQAHQALLNALDQAEIFIQTYTMCGRYRRASSEEELTKRYHIPIPIQSDLPISRNVAPSQRVLTIRRNPETSERSLDFASRRSS